MPRSTTVPGWVVFAGATFVASIFAGGAMGLLLEGRTIPVELWVLLTAIGTAYFGSGPFSVALGHLAGAGQMSGQTNAQLVDTVNHAIATLRDAVTAASTTATTVAAGGPPSVAAAGASPSG